MLRKQLASIGLAAVGLALGACAAQEASVWYKAGASTADYQAAVYECERDTRMVSPTFSRGVLIPAIEAQEFGSRCMNAKGYYLVPHSSAYPAAPMQKVVAPAPGPPRDGSGTTYGDNERVMCTFTITNGPVALPARTCVNGGGTIAGRASS